MERLGTRLGYTFHSAEERYAKVCEVLQLDASDEEPTIDRENFFAACRVDAPVDDWFKALRLRFEQTTPYDDDDDDDSDE